MLTIEGGLSPEYVLDKMQFYEIAPLVDHLHKKNRDVYEAARLVAYVVAQSNSRKKMKITDVLSFPWDYEIEHSEMKISNEDIERLTAKAQEYAKSNYQINP